MEKKNINKTNTQSLQNLRELSSVFNEQKLSDLSKKTKGFRSELDEFFAKLKSRDNSVKQASNEEVKNEVPVQAPSPIVEKPIVAEEKKTTTFIVGNTDRTNNYSRPNYNNSDRSNYNRNTDRNNYNNNSRPNYNNTDRPNYNNNADRTNNYNRNNYNNTSDRPNNYNRSNYSNNNTDRSGYRNNNYNNTSTYNNNNTGTFNNYNRNTNRDYQSGAGSNYRGSDNQNTRFNPADGRNNNRTGFDNRYGDRRFPNTFRPGAVGQFGGQKRNSEPLDNSLLIEKTNKYTTKNKFKEKSNKNSRDYDGDNKAFNRRRYFEENSSDFEEREYTRKLNKKKTKSDIVVMAPVTKAIVNSDTITVKDLSEKIGKTASEIIKRLFILGNMATINSMIDFETAELVGNDLGVLLELKAEKTAEEVLEDKIKETSSDDMETRPPIITIMGHVDHGKTSLLDAIRKTNVASGEAGGITQHIGAYTITKDGRMITFIDTPGHAAFTAMRARGAKITDIAILVVAADDGIMPQTIEAIHHIKAAKVPMIVAVNKIDKKNTNIDKIMQQLTEHEVVPEEWGGDAIIVPLSAKTGEGIPKLLEMMLLVADMAELKSNPNRSAIGTVIEAKLDKGRGPVATVLVQNGTLHVGDVLVSGTTSGKVKAMLDDNGNNVQSVGPSIAVAVLGFDDVPNAGDGVQVVDDKLSKKILQERKTKVKLEKIKSSGGLTIEDFTNANVDKKSFNLIIKADVQGSLEAIKSTISDLGNDEVSVNIIHGGVGSVTETDILLAQASNAIVIAFNTKTESKISNLADKSKVQIENYDIIYEIVDFVEAKVKGLETPKFKEVILGTAEILVVFKLSTAGAVAGSKVTSGVIRRNAKARILRNGEIIDTCTIESVKIVKDDVKEAREGFECGIKLGKSNFAQGDIIEAYVEEKIEV